MRAVRIPQEAVPEVRMHKINFIQAINEALAEEMERDPAVFIMGEDVRLGAFGRGDARARGSIRKRAGAQYPYFGGRFRRRGNWCRDGRVAAGRRNRVRQLFLLLLGSGLQSGRQTALHVRRAGDRPDHLPGGIRCGRLGSRP